MGIFVHLMDRGEMRLFTMFHQHTLLRFHLLHSAVVLKSDYHTKNSLLTQLIDLLYQTVHDSCYTIDYMFHILSQTVLFIHTLVANTYCLQVISKHYMPAITF
jgi:hypothetical protein